jgi:hypothetical protein
LHNCYGVDLNRAAVELAEVSLWLNVMHRGLQAPSFGLHLRRGNSLIGARRQVYSLEQLADKAWLKTAPQDCHLRDGPIPDGTIRHFLLMRAGSKTHPLAGPALLRTMRLNGLADAYANLWADLFHTDWSTESWAADWPGLDPLERGESGPLSAEWTAATPLRTERARRAALVKLDALMSVRLGISDEQLVAIYRSRYPQVVR